MPIEHELGYMERYEDRATIEHVSQDITPMLQKEKIMKLSAVLHWNMVVKKKEGKNEPNV